MKTYHNSPLLYEEGFSIIINEVATPIENSTFYYFDYDKRSHAINMDFPHFHSFYELMILLSPKAYHFVEGKRYDIIANDLVLLPPSVLHQSEYLPGPPSDRIIIGFMLPKQMNYGASGYKEILSVFNSSVPIFRFHKEEQNRLYQKLNEIVMIAKDTPNVNIRNLLGIGIAHRRYQTNLTNLIQQGFVLNRRNRLNLTPQITQTNSCTK